jgi:hypothetical protein
MLFSTQGTRVVMSTPCPVVTSVLPFAGPPAACSAAGASPSVACSAVARVCSAARLASFAVASMSSMT